MVRIANSLIGIVLASLLSASCGQPLRNVEQSVPQESKSGPTEGGLSLTSNPSFFGVNVHRPRGEFANKLMDKVSSAGLGWVRVDVSWDEIETQKGVYDWGKSDDVILAASRRGLEILANIHNTPKWANGDQAVSIPPKNPGDFGQFCRVVAERYSGKQGMPLITVFGVWNEPDGMGLGKKNDSLKSKQDAYVEAILKPCAQAIKSARSDAKIAAPELASENKFLDDVLSRAKQHIDIVTIHKYKDKVSDVISAVKDVQNIMSRHGIGKEKPLWLTEAGWSTTSKSRCWFSTVDSDTQARRISELLERLQSGDIVRKVFLYELMDDNVNPGACQWGLLRGDLSEKPSYVLLKSAARSKPGAAQGSQPKATTAKSNETSKGPNGSYLASCKDIVSTSSKISASCNDGKGRFVKTELSEPQKCRGDIANMLGKLFCKK